MAKEKDLKRITVRLTDDLLYKLHYVSEYEGLTMNAHLNVVIRRLVREFEKEHGEIKIDRSKKE